jgi:uncharacterized membrane protein
LAFAIITVGSLHFIYPDQFARMVPAYFLASVSSVYISGVFKILGGVDLLMLARKAGL